MSAGGSKFELDDRSYLREKVIEVYEKLWLRGAPLDASGWAELFFLKPNAAWLQSYLGSLTAARLRASTPTVRALWAECAARLGHEHEPSVRGHALETMSGILLGLGGVPLHSFASDAPELLTGLDEAEGCFDELAPMLRELLAPPSAAAAASPSAALTAIALRRSALRLLMAFALASDGLSANILLEFLLLRLASSWSPPAPAGGLKKKNGKQAGGATFAFAASLELGKAAELEDAARLLALLSQYRRHEAKNECLALLCTPAAARLLAPAITRAFRRAMFPAETAHGGGAAEEEEAGGEGGGGGSGFWASTLYRSLDWTARLAGLEDYLPDSVAEALAGPAAVARHLTAIASGLLLVHEWCTSFGGAPFAELCEAKPPPAPAPRAALLRELLGMLFLLSCQPAQGLHEATLLLGLLSLEAVLEAEATRTLLATADVSPSAAAGGMPIWRVYGGRTCEETLPGGQPLLAAAVELGSEIVGACAAAAAPSLPLAARAVGLLHRLLAHRASSGVGLPAVEWGSLVVRVFDLARCLATHPHLASSPSGAELAARLLGLLHHLLLCSEPLPPAVSDAVAAELPPFCAAGGVCGRLVAIARAGAPALLSSLQLAEPFCVAAPAARVDPDDAPAADLLVAKWRRAAPQAARVAAARAPPSPSARERDAAVQALLRLLIARSRADGSATPMHIEELLSPRKPAAA